MVLFFFPSRFKKRRGDTASRYPAVSRQYFFPLFSGSNASFLAAHKAAPLEMPTRIPFRCGNLCASREAHLHFRNRYNLIVNSGVQRIGYKPAPIPEFYENRFPPLKGRGIRWLTTAAIFTSGFSFKYQPTPVTVPPVPTPPTNKSTAPSVSSHISGPVVSKWA